MKREVVKGTQIMGIVAAIAGWMVPGLGHLVLRRWSKAAVYFLCVGGLAFAGLAMRGGVFGADAADLFDRLGFFADLGAGIFYFLAHQIQVAGPDVAHATGDYGTRMFAAAGMLNFLIVLEAYDIGRGGDAK
jgi:uncharacterized protein DUF6677